MITHPEKVLFPDDGITKGDSPAYYDAVAPVMLPHLRRRLITMERFPNGIGEQGFIQKDVSKGFPPWLKRFEAPKKGGTVHYPLAERSALAAVAGQPERDHAARVAVAGAAHRAARTCACSTWIPSRDEPDVLRDGDAAAARRARGARARELGEDVGLEGLPRRRPPAGARHVRRFGRAGGSRRGHPRRAPPAGADAGVRARPNATGASTSTRAATAPAPRSPRPTPSRPKPGAPVSAPCTWDEIEGGTVHPQSFTLRTMAERIAQVGDLWQDLTTARPATKAEVDVEESGSST